VLVAGVAAVLAISAVSLSSTDTSGRRPTTPAAGGTTRMYPISGFSGVDLTGAIEASITRGPFAVSVTAPRSVMSEMDVSSADNTLIIRRTGEDTHKRRVRVLVQLPDLRSLDLRNAVSATLSGWIEPVARVVRLRNAVNLSGRLSASTLQLTASNAVSVSLGGTVDALTMTAANAVQVGLQGLSARTAVLSVANGSNGVCNVTGEVTHVTVSGGSNLTLFGGAHIGVQDIDISSRLQIQ
jgi:hypothetical protein